MSSKLWAIGKVVIVSGAVVAVVGYFAGPAETATVTSNAVEGTAWGVGVLGGSVGNAGPGFKSGFDLAKGIAAPQDYISQREQDARDVAKLVKDAQEKEAARKAAEK